MEWKVPLTTLTIGVEEEEAALRVLRRGWLTMGPEVEAFEKEFAQAIGVRHALATANATDGLAVAYDAVGVGGDCEILMPALTFVASMNVALRRYATPVLVDINSEDDLTMSVQDLESKITARTALIVTMPYGGFASDLPAISALARKKHIPIIEDACHAPLATRDGRKVGSFGHAGVFSFFGNKNMTTGEGGMVVTNDRALVERMRLMRSHGITKSTFERHHLKVAEYDVAVAGHNFRMCELRAAIGREQLKKLPEANRRRGEIAQRIRSLILEKRDDIKFPFANRDPKTSAHHLLPAILPKKVDRHDFMQRMANQGVQTSIHYRPLHRFTHTTGLWPQPPRLPVLESIENRLVTLPLGPGFTDEQVELVAKATIKALG